MRLKKILTILLTLAMVVSLLPATAFAANNTATTMRLEKTQGTVNITNSTGKAVTQTDKMKLYNGYKVKTGAKSYAWISLDDTKVAKLDANSVMEVQKSGKNLTLYLSSGSMFFNVKDPLPKGENFHIRTSTMTTGIRGTSGCVRIVSDRVTEVHLLTGQVEIFASHPGLGLSKHAVLKAGQKATSLIDWEAMQKSGVMVDIIIEQLQNHEVCGNCAKEIEADAALRERIEREAPHLLPEQIAGSADERLAADEAAAEAKQAIIDEAIAKQEFPEEVDPYFEATSGGGGGGSSSGGSTGGGSSSGGGTTTDPDDPVTPPEEEVPATEKNVATWGALYTAIEEYNDEANTNNMIIYLRDENGEPVTIDGTEEEDTLLPVADKGDLSLTLNLGDSNLILNGSLQNNGNLTITNNQGYIKACDVGDWNNNSDYYYVMVENYGNLTHVAGQIEVPAGFTGVYNTSGATYTMTGENATIIGADGTPGTEDADGTYAILVQNDSTFHMQNGLLTVGAYGYGLLGAGDDTSTSMSDGIVKVSGTNATGIYVGSGTNTFSGGEISVTGADATGIAAYAEMTYSGTEITAENGLGMHIGGGEVAFAGGSVTAEADATAVQCESERYLTGEIKSTIRAKGEWFVFPLANANAPVGYEIVPDEKDSTYFKLKIIEDVKEVDAENFIVTLDSFDGSKKVTVKLKEPITYITSETVAAALNLQSAPTQLNVDAEGRFPLYIDLMGKELQLVNVSIVNGANGADESNNSNIVIIDSVGGGKITGAAEIMISNNGILDLQGGTIEVTQGEQIGINNKFFGIVNMTSGAITATGLESIAVYNYNEFNMSGDAKITTEAQGTQGIRLADRGAEANLSGNAKITVKVGSSYGIHGYSANVNMSGGEIEIAGIDGNIGILDSKLVMTGGKIYETATAEADVYLIENIDYPIELQGGTITAEYGVAVHVFEVRDMTLGDTIIKGKIEDNVFVVLSGNETGYTTVGPDASGYFTLIVGNSDNTPTPDTGDNESTEPGGDSGDSSTDNSGSGAGDEEEGTTDTPSAEGQDRQIAEQMIAYNMGGGVKAITLEADLVYAKDSILYAMLAEYGYDGFQGNGMITIDLNGHDLILNSTLYIGNYSGVTITDSVGTGKIGGSADVMIQLSDSAWLNLEDVIVEVAEDSQMGIDNTSIDDLAVGGTVTFLVKGDGAIGINDQSETAWVDSDCTFIVTGEGAAGIVPEQ